MRAGRYVTILRSNSWSRSKSDCTRHLHTGWGTLHSAHKQWTQFSSWLVIFPAFHDCITSSISSIICLLNSGWRPHHERNKETKKKRLFCVGGLIGFDKVLWEARKVTNNNGPSVQLTYHSHDGEQGIHM